jgi:hypothetical protein
MLKSSRSFTYLLVIITFIVNYRIIFTFSHKMKKEEARKLEEEKQSNWKKREI